VVFAGVCLLGCSDKEDKPPPDPEGPLVTVSTWNLYLGSDLTEVAAATDATLPGIVEGLWARVLASDFSERADRIASALAEAPPDILALQEVELFRTGPLTSGEAAPSAEEPVLDFLELLQGRLVARGLDYEVLEAPELVDAEMPCADDSGTFALRMTDRNALLVRSDSGLTVGQHRSESFHSFAKVPIGDKFVGFVRGYSEAEFVKDGRSFTVLTTHLETDSPAALQPSQVAQGRELVARVQSSAGDLIALGDFNSNADGSGTETYSLLRNELRDAWLDAGEAEQAYTCCQAPALDNAVSTASARIDLVLTRGELVGREGRLLGADASPDAPRWGSDHQGVRLVIQLPKP